MAAKKRIRELMEVPGHYTPGTSNTICDVPGVQVGHHTVHQKSQIHTGITLIKPHSKDIYAYPAPCVVHVGNGYGKLAGALQVEELGVMESIIGLTNTLSVPAVMQGIIQHHLKCAETPIKSINVLVGETNDSLLNDIGRLAIQPEDVALAIENLSPHVDEGAVGAGAGTCCYGYKGGIGTASRLVPMGSDTYTVGALVQTNFSGNLNLYGRPLPGGPCKAQQDGSCMIVVAVRAPVDARQLKRIARRGIVGMCYTGSYLANGSGDFCIAFSNWESNLFPRGGGAVRNWQILPDEQLNPLFEATTEAVQEAVYNSLVMAEDTLGHDGLLAKALVLPKAAL